MKTITTVEELMNELENGGYNYYGLRGASEHDKEILDSGRDYLDCSLDLWGERDCDFEDDVDCLNGTSAISVNDYMSLDELKERYNKALGYATNHHGTQTVYLLADKNGDYGDDEHEVVLGSNGCGADVLAIVIL